MGVWVRVAVIAVCVLLLFAVVQYGFAQVKVQMARLRGEKVEEAAAQYRPPYQLIHAAAYLSIISATALMGWRIYCDRSRLFGVVRARDFNRHLLVFGPTGSGKTSTALRAVELALRRGVSVAVLDWKGEYADRFRGATVIRKIRLLEPPNWDQAELHAMIVTDILRDVLQLTEPMSYMLFEEVSRMYEERAASFARLLEQLRARRAVAIANRAGAEANIAEGLIRRLLPLVLDERRPARNLRGSDRVVVYDLSDLPTYQLRMLYAEIILWRIYNEARSAPSRGLKKLIVCEEAQNYVRLRRVDQPPSIGERVVNELRAYGHGCVLIAPDPYQLPLHMPRDAGAVISIGYQALPEIVADLLSFYRYADVRKLIKTAGRPRTYIYHEGRLHTRGIPRPFKRAIDLGVEAVEEAVELVVEAPAERPKLRLEEEPEPSGGASQEMGGGGADEAAPRLSYSPAGQIRSNGENRGTRGS